jgi:nucleotide-binding universal stress UspA family protein
MTYSTLMSHLDVGENNDGVLAITAALADRFGAAVVGIAARRPVQVIGGGGMAAAELYEFDRKDLAEELGELEAEFRAALGKNAREVRWRSASVFGSLAGYVAREARLVDLIITRPDRGLGILNGDRRMSLGDLIMSAGRPLFIVPDGARSLNLDQVVVAWNDTRESRRAVADALPLLQAAGKVAVVEVTDEHRLAEARERLEDVIWWLDRHGVAAEALPSTSRGGDAALLDDIAHDRKAGLMVAGAYGHNRMREWVFGGVTCDLLLHPSRCTFVSR